MNVSAIVVPIAIVIALVAIGLVVIVLNQKAKGKITDKPNELQFGNRKYIPPDGYVDTNIVKVGKTRTFIGVLTNGSMSWDDFFNPKEGQEEKRKTAAYMLIGFFVIASAVTATLYYLDVTWGAYLGVLMILYAALIMGINYLKK